MADAAPARDPGAVRDATRDVFSRPEFAEQQHHWWNTLLEIVTDPVGSLLRLIAWLIERLPDGAFRPAVAWIFAVLAVLVIAFLVFRFTRSVSSDAVAPVLFGEGPHTRSASEWAAEARAHEAEGAWRDAIRARYASLLAGLGEQGIVRPRAGMTTGEYVREVETNAPHQAQPFREATALFEWVWYGDGEATQDDAARMRTLAADTGVKAAA